jgi:hypothetical protein
MGWFPDMQLISKQRKIEYYVLGKSSDTANNGDDMLFNPTSVYGYDEEGNPFSEGYYNSLYKYYQKQWDNSLIILKDLFLVECILYMS